MEKPDGPISIVSLLDHAQDDYTTRWGTGHMADVVPDDRAYYETTEYERSIYNLVREQVVCRPKIMSAFYESQVPYYLDILEAGKTEAQVGDNPKEVVEMKPEEIVRMLIQTRDLAADLSTYLTAAQKPEEGSASVNHSDRLAVYHEVKVENRDTESPAMVKYVREKIAPLPNINDDELTKLVQRIERIRAEEGGEAAVKALQEMASDLVARLAVRIERVDATVPGGPLGDGASLDGAPMDAGSFEEAIGLETGD